MYYKEICCEICFLLEDRGQQWLKFMSVNEPLPVPQRDSARDNTGETILTSARDPTSRSPSLQLNPEFYELLELPSYLAEFDSLSFFRDEAHLETNSL